MCVRSVFFCYPTICIVSFATFLCRQLNPSVSVLDADGSVFCEDPSHRALMAASGIVIAVVAVGLPVVFGCILVTTARHYQRHAAGSNREMAHRMASELSVEQSAAEYVVRDVCIGQSYSFLMDAYKPKFLYCKCCTVACSMPLVAKLPVALQGRHWT